MDYTLNIVSKCCFSLYLNILGLRKGPGKFFMGVLESPGKVLDFFVSKRVGTLVTSVPCWCHVTAGATVSLNAVCGPDDVCDDVNARCVGGLCRCRPLYYQDSNVCS